MEGSIIPLYIIVTNKLNVGVIMNDVYYDIIKVVSGRLIFFNVRCQLFRAHIGVFLVFFSQHMHLKKHTNTTYTHVLSVPGITPSRHKSKVDIRRIKKSKK